MNKNWVLTQNAFDSLLGWLDSDREVAGQKYEDIRKRLIKVFKYRGCIEPEDLADETINRVTSRLSTLESFVGEPGRYFYGVANKVYQEYLRRKRAPDVPPPPPPSPDEDVEQEFECLQRCLEKLTLADRKLLIEYYQNERKAKIDHRKRLAEQLGIAINALRIRAFRLRALLQECVTNCVREAVPETDHSNRHTKLGGMSA